MPRQGLKSPPDLNFVFQLFTRQCFPIAAGVSARMLPSHIERIKYIERFRIRERLQARAAFRLGNTIDFSITRQCLEQKISIEFIGSFILIAHLLPTCYFLLPPSSSPSPPAAGVVPRQ